MSGVIEIVPTLKLLAEVGIGAVKQLATVSIQMILQHGRQSMRIDDQHLVSRIKS